MRGLKLFWWSKENSLACFSSKFWASLTIRYIKRFNSKEKKNRNYKLDFSSSRIILICQVPKVEEMSKIFLGISCLKSRLRNVTKTKTRLIRDTLISIQKKKPLEHWTTFCQSKLLFLRFSIRNCFVHVLEMGCIQQAKKWYVLWFNIRKKQKTSTVFLSSYWAS